MYRESCIGKEVLCIWVYCDVFFQFIDPLFRLLYSIKRCMVLVQDWKFWDRCVSDWLYRWNRCIGDWLSWLIVQVSWYQRSRQSHLMEHHSLQELLRCSNSFTQKTRSASLHYLASMSDQWLLQHTGMFIYSNMFMCFGAVVVSRNCLWPFLGLDIANFYWNTIAEPWEVLAVFSVMIECATV